MAKRCRVAVDLLGAEAKSRDLFQGAISVVGPRPDCELTVICDRNDLSHMPTRQANLIHCSDWVKEGDSLMHVLRDESKTSMKIGLELLAAERVDGFVSLGNTGALMALCRHTLTMPSGIDRPAIIKEFSGKRNRFWMLDVGANIIQKAESLVQFAHLGIAFAEGIGRIEHPRVSLLNIGVETKKGPELLRTAAAELTADPKINFCGYVEPNRLFDGVADVIVSDGFAGNVALKSIEGAASMMRYKLRAEFASSNANLQESMRESLRNIIDSFDAQAYNGASFIGLNGVVVKGHSSATPLGMAAAVNQAIREIDANVPIRIRHHLKLKQGGAG